MSSYKTALSIITIITPSREQLWSELISSVTMQQGVRIKWIICCPSLDDYAKFTALIPRNKHIQPVPCIVGEIKNIGYKRMMSLSKVNTELVAIIDDDDMYYSPVALSSLCDRLLEDRYCIANFGKVLSFYPEIGEVKDDWLGQLAPGKYPTGEGQAKVIWDGLLTKMNYSYLYR